MPTPIDDNSEAVICETALIEYLKTDDSIEDLLCHFHEDQESKAPAIIVGFKTGEEHPKNSGICEYEGEIKVRDNITKTGSSKDTLDAYVRSVEALFVGVNLRSLRDTLTNYIPGGFKVYGVKYLGSGERVTQGSLRVHPIHVNLIAMVNQA